MQRINEPQIIEGRHIYEYINPDSLKGKIIIKRTSLMNAYKRAFKRDVGKRIELYKKGEIKIINIFDKIYERIKIPIYDYIKINRFINKMLKKMILKRQN